MAKKQEKGGRFLVSHVEGVKILVSMESKSF